ncbi:hypothetical protein DOTSEDRAFT_27612 [Dothistroma septosporum NZE10]|uniref:BTB domain-containing protein n=1 Tax=Dothistroma septosporum (strain NZE10 / CBS 128990) TaxID=675120 RepID=N1PFY7_DOTSN|nr:hypothetical protein DOTSEDRAFT_27612 [Dothistroma septosporum NZE10]
MAAKHFDLNEARAAANQNLTKLRRDDAFCDLTVECGNTSIKAHRVILAARLRLVLESMRWWEGKAPCVTLEGDDGEDVASMIEFCYTFSYAEATAKDCGPLTKAVRMFALGDKYLISTLQTFAVDAFIHHLETSWDEQDFFEAVKLVYTGLSDPQRLLHNTIVETLRARYTSNSTWSTAFNDLLDITPGLAADAFRAIAQQPITTSTLGHKLKLYKCPAHPCPATFLSIIGEDEAHLWRCPYCHLISSLTGKGWELYIISE